MKRIGQAGLKLPFEIPLPSGFILGVHKQRTDACNISRLRSAQQRVLQQGFAQACPLMLNIHGQSCQNHDWDGVLRDALDHSRRSSCGVDTADSKAVKPNHRTTVTTHVGLRAIGPLVDQRKALQKLIECSLAAIKGLDGVRAGQFANWLIRTRTQPSNPGSDKSFLSLGLAVTGRSSAA